MTLPANTRLGPYEIRALLGAGGMGEVYRARDTRLNRDVAIKILPPAVADHPSRRARFAREARSISQLSHPNICTIHDVGEEDGIAFLVMEYIEGESLDKRLRLGPVPWALALEWAIQIADAIEAAHRRGMIHRDLKPGNIMVGESGVKLLDFGLAKLLEGSDGPGENRPTESITAEQKILGTLHYMSPEQLEGREVDPRTDVFAFGVTLYEMVTGRKAFDGTSAASVSAAILTAEPAPVSSSDAGDPIAPTGLDHVIRRALAKHPDDRWQTARDMMLELRWLKDGRPRIATTRSAAWRGPRWLAAGAAAVATVAGAFGWWAGVRQSEAVDQPMIAFTIGAPPGTRLGPGSVAVSPDSRKITFLAGPGSDDKLVWWQSLDSTVAHVIPGTEGSHKPFWSHDSHSIGFYHERQLKRVRIDGGLPEVIAAPVFDREAAVMAFWSHDGTIVFGQPGKPGNQLFRVKAAGGEPPVPLSINGSMPRGLPGDRFLYLVPHISPDGGGLRIQGPGLSAPVAVPVQSNAVYAAGFLVFRQGESLVAQPFDAGSLRLRGNPTTIAEDVGYNAASGWTPFDVSSDLLAYKSADSRKLVWRNRDGTLGGSIGEIGDMNPALAPGASGRVAVDRWDIATNTFHITMIDGLRSTQMTRGRRERFPIWSPDGRWIVYVFVNADGDELRRQSSDSTQAGDVLLRRPQRLKVLDYSRDGNYLVFRPEDLPSKPDLSGAADEGDDLWVLPLVGDDKQPRRLTNTPAVQEKTARLSPNVRWIAYTAEDDGRPDIWVQQFPSGALPRRITTNGGWDPSWRQDGKELYYVTNDGTLMALPVETDAVFTSGTPSALFKFDPGTIGVPLHLYSATPDGSRFLVGEVVRSPEVITLLVHWTSLLRPPYPPR